MKSPKFWTIFVLLLATAFVLESRGDTDSVPASEPLRMMPRTFSSPALGSWSSQDFPLDDDTLAVLGKGDFLNRMYTSSQPLLMPAGDGLAQTSVAAPPISLFIGYFPTQRTGQTMHSPQHCLPGAGWTFDSEQYVTLKDAAGKNLNVGEYVISNGETKQFVIYWYQAHGRSVPNEYFAKLYMVADAIRTNRTDGALVRVITPILSSETFEQARQRATLFTQQMAPTLPRFIPD
ncbi:MAG: EpsI family protein [Acidobacteriota bacterium]|nr:EpsI family protein [Acidobacteriota bacterium]